MKKAIDHTGDNCNGQITCYALVDQFFDRRVMLNSSWSGGSKRNVPKFAIRDSKNILGVFFGIVHNPHIFQKTAGGIFQLGFKKFENTQSSERLASVNDSLASKKNGKNMHSR